MPAGCIQNTSAHTRMLNKPQNACKGKGLPVDFELASTSENQGHKKAPADKLRLFAGCYAL